MPRSIPRRLRPDSDVGAAGGLSIDLDATSNWFPPGHRIRLEISISAFPPFDRNLNTGATTATKGYRRP
ncbi:MAG: hypothetical protein EOQ96_15115 [Mesorhizobium sp.]|nr:MAG: hypothetical protein EOQ96_15115 [Mesorhizobium sp.]